MSALAGLRLLVVSAGAERARVEALREAGAIVDEAGAEHDLLLALSELAPHLVVVGETSAELGAPAIVRAVRNFAPEVPCLVLVRAGDAAAVAALLAGGEAALLAAEASPATLVAAAAAHAAGPARAGECGARLQLLEDECRAGQRRLEELREQIDVMEHDLRTPLVVIAGFASNARDGVDGPVTAGQAEGLDQIVKAALRMGALLDETLGFIRGQAAGDPVMGAPTRRTQRRQFDLAAVAAEVVALFSDEARRRRTSLELEGESCLMLWGDAGKLAQALTNLVANALKFTPPGGRIRCALRLADGGESQRRHAELTVSDSGPGIPAEARELIFERGFRLARDGEVPGRGLGLSVCREVAKLHGGEITAHSGEDGGAALVLSLPLDLRARAPGGILVLPVDQGPGSMIVDALCSDGPDRFATITSAQLERFLPMAAECEAVVVVRRDGRPSALEAALKRIRGLRADAEGPAAPPRRTVPR